MPTYLHLAKCCNQEFEDFYSIKTDPPTKCPFCNIEGQVQRLVSGGAGKGIVEVTGHELKAKLKAEGQELKKSAMKSETVLANLVGESKYQSNTVQMEKAMANRPKFQYRKKSER